MRRRWLPRWLKIVLLSLLFLLAAAFALAWWLRYELASGYIDGELRQRGVRASYRITRIGFGGQVFEDLRIGDPRRPDLVAEHVEIRLRLGLSGPYLGLIRARGVRLAGRIGNGRLSLGEVDKLLPPPSGEPFRLPDQVVELRDTAIALRTPSGDVALALSGRGNLAYGFRGTIVGATRELSFGDCRLEGAIARLALRVADRRPRLSGPAAAHALRCGEAFAADRALLSLRVLLDPGLDAWRGAAALRIARLRANAQSLSNIQGRASFGGDAEETEGNLDLASGPARVGGFDAAGATLQGRYALARIQGLSLGGEIAARGLAADLSGVVAGLNGARGTPIGPIAERLAAALAASGRGVDGRARLRLLARPGGGAVNFAGLRLESRSGARLTATGGEGIDYSWPSGMVGINGAFALSGGGLPEARFVLHQPRPGGPIVGRGRIAAMAAGGARLALGEIAFTAAADGETRFRTSAVIDGPFSGGRVTRLALPLNGRFGRRGLFIGEGCVAAGFQSLRLGPSRLPLCPAGRAMVADGRFGVELRAPRLAGRLGGSPIGLAAGRVRVDSAGFAATGVAIRLRGASGSNRLDIARLDGRFGARGVAGRYAGLAGELANVPLLVSDGEGVWRMPGGDLVLEGSLTVSDRQAPVRFHPLAGERFRLTLVDNRIRATGLLLHPASRTRVLAAAIDHDLNRGAGGAVLDVAGLRFAPGGLQPDTLTPLSVGVVALVDGAVSGQARIQWDMRGTRSTGSFSTEEMALAAPFGPVEGLATRIDFTDLLGLTSAPGQEARVRLIRAGIDVYDGVVRYRIRPNYQIGIEQARWPLAGGTLTLEPTNLDFARESTKYLTFRVEALDAARFIQLMQFSNISATGTYDGTVPMQFTDRGGRIVGGRLVARPGGGTLSYIGEVSRENLGPYGALAFDALKAMRYSRLELTLDGALDGEFLTRIDMDGLARDLAGTSPPEGGIPGMVVGRVLNQLARVPFHFNIRIQGPFRGLVATARSFQDPSDLIRAALPGLMDGQTPAEPLVQPQDSEPVR